MFNRIIGPAIGCGWMIGGAFTHKNMYAISISCAVATMFFSMMVVGLIEYAVTKLKEK